MMSALAHEHFIHADNKREHPAKAKKVDQLTAVMEQLRIDRGTLERVAKHLMEQGVAREQIRPTLGAITRLAKATQGQKGKFKIDAPIKKHLVERLRLNGQQIQTVLDLAKRVAAHLEGQKTAGHGHEAQRQQAKNKPQLAELKAHYEGRMKRIEAAVRRGDLSTEEAQKKVELMKREIQAKMKHLRQAQSKKEDPRKQRYGAVLKRVKAAVESGRVDEAKAKEHLEKAYLRLFPEKRR